MNPNHYLAVAIQYLFTTRPGWRGDAAIGKTLVSSSMIDRVGAALGRRVAEVPVGFKWFVPGLLDGSFGFGGEESAGASFLRKDGSVWTTDKDGIILGLLAAEITATHRQGPRRALPGADRPLRRAALRAHGRPRQRRAAQGAARSSPPNRSARPTLAGEPILAKLTKAPGNGAAIGGLKVVTENGWFAARPFGHRGRLQDLRGKLQGAGAPGRPEAGGPGDRHGGVHRRGRVATPARPAPGAPVRPG